MRWNTDERYRINMRAYFRMVSGIDNAIGRFIKALEARGLADNTIIVYTADNGYHMGNRGFAGSGRIMKNLFAFPWWCSIHG